MFLKDVSDFVIDDFSGRQAPQSGSAAISLDDTHDGIIRDSRAKGGCDIFVEIRGQDSRTVYIANSDVSRAAKPLIFADGALPGSAICEKCK